MSKKVVCSVIRIATMTLALVVLQQVYQVGLVGGIMVGLTGVVWAVTADIEHDR